MPSPTPLTSARLAINPPRLLTGGAVLTVCFYGVLLMVPVLISLLAVSVLQLGLLTWLVPLATVAAVTCFLPFGFGNPHVAKLARSLAPPADNSPDRFIVQLTFTPRLRSGLRGLIEDADDIGWLGFSESELIFRGDSVQLSLPFDQVRQVTWQSIGARGLFLYPSLKLEVSGLSKIETLTLAERSSWLLPAARATTRKLRDRLAQRIPAGKPPA